MTRAGRWESPISTDQLTANFKKTNTIAVDGVFKRAYFIEQRPSEKGRNCLLELKGDLTTEELLPEYNLTTEVHEYGGAPLAVLKDTLLFVSRPQNSIYIKEGNKVRILLDQSKLPRRTNFADFNIHPSLEFAVFVCEEHFSDDAAEVVNSIALIDFKSGELIHLVKGNDFYSSPRFSPDGKTLVWIQWNHPEMPWTKSSLWAGSFSGKCISTPFKISINEKEAISRPLWGSNSLLYFSSDVTGYFNIFSFDFSSKQMDQLTNLESDFSGPDWVFGESSYDVYGDKLVVTYLSKGQNILGLIDPKSKNIKILYSEFTLIRQIRVWNDKVLFIGTKADQISSLYGFDLKNNNLITIRKATDTTLDPEYLSIHQFHTFPTTDGTEGYLVYYPPKNPKYKLDELPPAVVYCHGGPSSAFDAGFSLNIQFWTTRGFAFVAVNYGGSTGFGRNYRERLDGQWGIVDVDDSCKAAEYLVNKGLVDPQRLAIQGGSAGGYTVLACLTFRPNVFKAGTSKYGICSLESLAELTHKFEAHYLNGLLGGSIKEVPQVYHDRSPIYFASNITSPLLVQQGSVDKVVPPNQAELIVNAIKKKGGKVEYQLFEGEGHGFRQAEHIKQAFQKELEFYLEAFKI